MRPHDAETGEELERSELVRGYEFSKGRYIVLTENELEAIDLELPRTLDLAKFVDLSEVDLVHLDTPYYVAPDGIIGDETSGCCARRRTNQVRPGSDASS
jgi:DNA end-binding protein Ku